MSSKPKNKEIKDKPWLHKSPSQLTPDERLRAYAATGVSIKELRRPGNINPKTKRGENNEKTQSTAKF